MTYLTTRFLQVAPATQATITWHYQRKPPPIAPTQTHMRTPVGKTEVDSDTKVLFPTEKNGSSPVAGKKQDHDCPFSLAITPVVITILVRPSRSGSICKFSQSGSGDWSQWWGWGWRGEVWAR